MDYAVASLCGESVILFTLQMAKITIKIYFASLYPDAFKQFIKQE